MLVTNEEWDKTTPSYTNKPKSC